MDAAMLKHGGVLYSVHPEVVNFGSARLSAIALATAEGMSIFENAGIAELFRGLPADALWRDFEKRKNVALGQKMPFLDGQ